MGTTIGIDIGGTFTDILCLREDGTLTAKKVPSTPDDYSRAVLEAVDEDLATADVRHGHTVATNTLLEHRGERAALITTRGFRDVLELGRLRAGRLYDLLYKKPKGLIDRALRFEVTERLDPRGRVLQPLSLEELDAVLEEIRRLDVRSVAVCFLHAYANPEHERAVGRRIHERLPDVCVTLSSELLPVMKEYERTSSAAVNAYIRPRVERYLSQLDGRLRSRGLKAPLSVMQSNGGLSHVESAYAKPIFYVESGPAAGVVGGLHIGRRKGLRDILTFDMGGTTAKASLIEDGRALMTSSLEVGGEINVGRKLAGGGGYRILTPAIDLAEVSAGGGSIASVDKAGGLRIGPRSAGSRPGPACYGLGGEDPTVTDADVLLGYLHPEALLGGGFPLRRDRAEEAVRRSVAEPMGLDVIRAAHGIRQVVNSNMARALRAVSSERGRDPRRFALLAFGGNGPVHAAGLAELLDIKRVLVPPAPGLFSSLGLIFADIEHHLVRSCFRPLSEAGDLREDLDLLGRAGRELLERHGQPDGQIEFTLGLRYAGQTEELEIPVGPEAETRFHEAHRREFGYSTEEPIQLVSLRAACRGTRRPVPLPERFALARGYTPISPRRKIYFGAWEEVDVLPRADLSATPRPGPLVVEEYDSSTIVPPGWSASLDALDNILLER
ncbi:MAG TPA: hydantoinase/oxoprolinase family protein [Planctomycetota bacterium]